jgi:hypothetical protein
VYAFFTLAIGGLQFFIPLRGEWITDSTFSVPFVFFHPQNGALCDSPAAVRCAFPRYQLYPSCEHARESLDITMLSQFRTSCDSMVQNFLKT